MTTHIIIETICNEGIFMNDCMNDCMGEYQYDCSMEKCEKPKPKPKHRPQPCVINVSRQAAMNMDFRTTPWTGCYAQMTLMCIPKCQDIGWEIHEDTDQIIRIEQGFALVKVGKCEEHPELCVKLGRGDALFVPAGSWHNVINIGRCPLKLSSVYAPPHHPAGTVHHTKEDAVSVY